MQSSLARRAQHPVAQNEPVVLRENGARDAVRLGDPSVGVRQNERDERAIGHFGQRRGSRLQFSEPQRDPQRPVEMRRERPQGGELDVAERAFLAGAHEGHRREHRAVAMHVHDRGVP